MPFRRGSAVAKRVAKRLKDAAAQRRVIAEHAAVGPQLPLAAIGGDAPAPASGKGRPKGARSWDHDQFSRYMELRGYTDPRVMWAETISRPVAVLAAELGIKEAEAFNLQLRAAENLAPFVSSKMPLAVAGSLEVRDQRSDEQVAQGIFARLMAVREARSKSVENQRLIDGAAVEVGQSPVGQQVKNG